MHLYIMHGSEFLDWERETCMHAWSGNDVYTWSELRVFPLINRTRPHGLISVSHGQLWIVFKKCVRTWTYHPNAPETSMMRRAHRRRSSRRECGTQDTPARSLETGNPHAPGSSGGATRYTGYAPAYPAKPAASNINILYKIVYTVYL